MATLGHSTPIIGGFYVENNAKNQTSSKEIFIAQDVV